MNEITHLYVPHFSKKQCLQRSILLYNIVIPSSYQKNGEIAICHTMPYYAIWKDEKSGDQNLGFML